MSIKKWMKETHGIDLYHINGPKKCMIAERAIRTVKRKLYRVMFFLNSLRWIDSLQSVEDSINATESRVLLNYSPRDIVTDPKKQKEIKKMHARNFSAHTQKFSKPPRYSVGTKVRYLLAREQFPKLYKPQMSEQTKTIRKVLDRSPTVYYLENMSRPFYESELIEDRSDQTYGPTSLAFDEPSAADKSGDTSAKRDSGVDGINSGQRDGRTFIIEKSRQKSGTGRVNRSGKISGYEQEFLLKNIADQSYSKWVSAKDVEQLRKNGLLFDVHK